MWLLFIIFENKKVLGNIDANKKGKKKRVDKFFDNALPKGKSCAMHKLCNSLYNGDNFHTKFTQFSYANGNLVNTAVSFKNLDSKMDALENLFAQKDYPKHIAIVMDGNGRWAKQRGKPRLIGHAAGVKALRRCVVSCVNFKIPYLTVFAFSSENWRRPIEEITGIMNLFIKAIQSELPELNRNGVQVRFIGNRQGLSPSVKRAMERAEQMPVKELKMTLVIAMNYGGRWDITQAAQQLMESGQPFDEQNLAKNLDTRKFTPDPDLVIRTGGEMRISNFLLWQAAYAELYFSKTLWPDFSETDLLNAMQSYACRERRFGALPLEEVH